jgi:hypothetical protein
MRNILIAAAIAGIFLVASSAARAEDKEHKAPHGGILLEVGEEVAHVEVVHDAKAGKITLYILGGDAKTELAVKETPKVNLKSEKGGKQLETKAVGGKEGAASQFEATDEALKVESPKGRIVLVVADKKYNIDLK